MSGYDGSSVINANFEGLLYDIQEDNGYEQYDLVLWILEKVVADVQEFMASGPTQDERDKDKLYALVGLLNEVDGGVLLQYLSKDNGVYEPEVCGGLRLESYVGESE